MLPYEMSEFLGAVAICAVVAVLATWAHGMWEMSMEQSIWFMLLSVGVGGAIGIVSPIITVQLRQRLLGPRIHLEFGDGEGYRSRTPEMRQAVADDPETVSFGRAIAAAELPTHFYLLPGHFDDTSCCIVILILLA